MARMSLVYTTALHNGILRFSGQYTIGMAPIGELMLIIWLYVHGDAAAYSLPVPRTVAIAYNPRSAHVRGSYDLLLLCMYGCMYACCTVPTYIPTKVGITIHRTVQVHRNKHRDSPRTHSPTVELPIYICLRYQCIV
ncbi:hypothetical protein F5B21DRAFT_422093 [Xylaria acuta]|nr:hypothetical protein F5B21DRAFT_422093 [Xylaria acuta]